MNHRILYMFVISDVTDGHWPSFRELVRGMPPRTAAKRYQIALYDLTEGIKWRLEQSKN